MPGWVLAVTEDVLSVPELEEWVRLAGYSLHRAPDVARMEVLLHKGEDPVAVIVDLVSTGQEGLAALGRMAGKAPLIAIAGLESGEMLETLSRAGAHVLGPEEVADALPALLANLGCPG